MRSRTARILWPIFWTLLGLASLGALLALNSTAREVATETAKTLFGIFSTPFIFEFTVGLIGLLLLLGINQWRLKKEGDGWVYMVTQDPDESAGQLPAAITQRLQGIVLHEKPETMDEAGIARAHIEGFLELGMAAQAAAALEHHESVPDDLPGAVLRVRVLAANLDTAAARELLHASATRFAGNGALFAQTALECADWFKAHAPKQREAVELWMEEARGIRDSAAPKGGRV